MQLLRHIPLAPSQVESAEKSMPLNELLLRVFRLDVDSATNLTPTRPRTLDLLGESRNKDKSIHCGCRLVAETDTCGYRRLEVWDGGMAEVCVWVMTDRDKQ